MSKLADLGAFIINATIVVSGLAVGLQTTPAHAKLSDNGGIVHIGSILKNIVVGTTGEHELRDKNLDSYTHTGSLRIYSSNIKDLSNLGSTRIYDSSNVGTFDLLGSVEINDSKLGSGSILGSTKLFNSTITGSLGLTASTVEMTSTTIGGDVKISDPQNGHQAHISLKSTHIVGQLICSHHCTISKTSDSNVEGGIVN